MALQQQYMIYFIINTLIGSFCLGMAVHFFLNRKILRFPTTGLLLLFVWLWLFGELLEYSFEDFNLKIVFNNLQFVATSALPVAWIAFCHQFRFDKNIFTRKPAWLLLLLPIVFISLTYTNNLHHWLWAHPTIGQQGLSLAKDYTILFYVLLITTYTMIVAGGIILISSLREKRYYKRRQTRAILLAAIVPLSINIVEVFSGFFNVFFELAPLSFSMVCLIAVYYVQKNYEGYTLMAQHTIIESLSEALILLDEHNGVLYANPEACRVLKVSLRELLGKSILQYIPTLEQVLKRVKKTNKLNLEEFLLGGLYYQLSLSSVRSFGQLTTILMLKDITPLKISEERYKNLSNELEGRVQERTKRLDSINVSLRKEVAERKKSEDKLSHTLEEKEILISEIHHRVKNNLQLISSLLKLQRNVFDDDEIRNVFQNAVSRIKAIAIIHEKLYQTNQFETVNVRTYIKSLLDYLLGMHLRNLDEIQVETDIEELDISLGTCILLGLVINEMVINTLKHAFGENHEKKKNILVELKKTEKILYLTVKDDGKGFPETILKDNGSGNLGFKIIRTLCGQLDAELTLQNRNGAEYHLRFTDKEGF